MINTDLQDELVKINVETLLIRWEKDTYTPCKNWKIMNKLIKNSKMIVIENATHWIHLKMPEQLVECITNYVINE